MDRWIGVDRCFGMEAALIELSVPGELAYRDLAMRVVTTACKLVRVERDDQHLPLDEEFVFEAVSAVGEAFNNVAIHGYRPGAVGIVVLAMDTQQDGLVIDVKDFGESFDPCDAPEPNLGELPESGMGLFIIRAFVDEIHYERGNPNCLRMVKRFGLGSRSS